MDRPEIKANYARDNNDFLVKIACRLRSINHYYESAPIGLKQSIQLFI